MKNQNNKEIQFEVQLHWLTGKKGMLSAKDATGTLRVSTPPKFGGTGKPWTPEHFFLSAISSCFMTTYLSFADKFGFEILNLECNASGEIKIVEGKYKFTKIDLYSKIYLADETLREKATSAAEKAHKYCLISNSVKADISYHSEVIVDKTSAVKHPSEWIVNLLYDNPNEI